MKYPQPQCATSTHTDIKRSFRNKPAIMTKSREARQEFARWRLTPCCVSGFNRHSPDDIQIRGNRTTGPPPRELHPSAAIRWPDFGDRLSSGRPFDQIFRHSDTPFPSFSPGRRYSRPTPERVFVVDHRSGSGFSGTIPSAPPPRPIGT